MTRTAAELANYLGAALEGDPRIEIEGVASPERALADNLIYVDSSRHLDRAAGSAARCAIANPGTRLPGKTIIEAKDPKFAFAKAAAWLLPKPASLPMIHSTAIVPASARVAATASIGAYVVIEDEVEIGAHTVIEPFCFVGRGAHIGENCWLHPRVTLYAGARLGNRVEVHSGAVIGGDGFGYVFGEGRYWKFPQIGGVEIGDDVEDWLLHRRRSRFARIDTNCGRSEDRQPRSGRSQCENRGTYCGGCANRDFRQQHPWQECDRRRAGRNRGTLHAARRLDRGRAGGNSYRQDHSQRANRVGYACAAPRQVQTAVCLVCAAAGARGPPAQARRAAANDRGPVTWNPNPSPLRGSLVVVGGQCRKVGKTALVTDLILALRDFEWTAIKITPHSESECPVNGPGCGCAPAEHTFAIREESDPAGTTDTSRFLAAGARRALWVQAKSGRFIDMLQPLTAALEEDRQVIIESNAIAEFWRPDMFLIVLDPANPDFKESARNALVLADAFVFRSPFPKPNVEDPESWKIRGTPKFMHTLGQPLPAGMQGFARQLLARPSHPIGYDKMERKERFRS